MPSKSDILLFGGSGRLGKAVLAEAALRGSVVAAPSSTDCDITDSTVVEELARSLRPSILLNCAGFADVDRAECQKNRCWELNVFGAENIAAAAAAIGSPVVYMSTDFVFDGGETVPYVEDDIPNPLAVYARSKLAGEQATLRLSSMAFVVRTSALFGSDERDFVATIKRTAADQGWVEVVEDITTSPTHVADVARNLMHLVHTSRYGVYHMVSKGACSWFEFASELIALSKLQVDVRPVAYDQMGRLAARPFYSVLDNRNLRKAGLDMMPHWKESLRREVESRRRLASRS